MKKIGTKIIAIFAIIFVMLILIVDSDFIVKRTYFRHKELRFEGRVIHKNYDYGEKSAFPGDVYLNSGRKLRVKKRIFDKVQIGDSIVKKQNCDSIYYYTNEGLIIDDENKFLREKHLKRILKKNN